MIQSWLQTLHVLTWPHGSVVCKNRFYNCLKEVESGARKCEDHPKFPVEASVLGLLRALELYE